MLNSPAWSKIRPVLMIEIHEILQNYKTNSYNGLPDREAISKKYNPQNLTTFDLHQVATWDECHRKVIPGADNNETGVSSYKKIAIKFPKNEHGQINIEHGTYSNETVCTIHAHVDIRVAVFFPPNSLAKLLSDANVS